MRRTATVERRTRETEVSLSLDLDGSGTADLDSSIPFLDHMLEQVCRHGLIDLRLRARGDREIDDHHTVEDIGICLGEALRDALGGKEGIRRYGHAYVPLDEALSRVVLDLSGRPGLTFAVRFAHARVGGFETALFREFFQALVNHARITLHVDTIRGENDHHVIETVFKAFGRALREAASPDPRRAEDEVPSTKGAL